MEPVQQDFGCLENISSVSIIKMQKIYRFLLGNVLLYKYKIDLIFV